MGEDVTPTLISRYETPTGNTQDGLNVISIADHPTPKVDEKGIAYTLESRDYKCPQAVMEQAITYRKTGHAKKAGDSQGWQETDTNDTLNIFDNAESRTPTLVVEKKFRVYDWHRQDTRMTELKDVCTTAAAGWGGGGNNMPYVMEESMDAVVRRLTSLECERLQGFPDGWTDIGEWIDSKGKKHKDADSPRYKALGNSIAVGYANGKTGFWCWMAERMVKQLKKDGVDHPKMASLFDGIGGFPLAFSAYGCEPVWASEIEEFPIAVTKIRFPEEEE